MTRTLPPPLRRLLDRLDDPEAALRALDTKFGGDVNRWTAWLRWLDEAGYRAE